MAMRTVRVLSTALMSFSLAACGAILGAEDLPSLDGGATAPDGGASTHADAKGTTHADAMGTSHVDGALGHDATSPTESGHPHDDAVSQVDAPSSTDVIVHAPDSAPVDAFIPVCKLDSDCIPMLPTTTPPNCAVGSCVAPGLCTFASVDADGDGYTAANCISTNGVPIATGDDCNDNDANLYPGHPEACTTTPDGGAPGGTLCASGQISCLPNGQVSACTGTIACSGQACVSGACTGMCAPGQTQCTTDLTGFETCGLDGTWGAAVTCTDETCAGSGGTAGCQGSCAQGEAPQCGTGTSSGYVQTCNTSGAWVNAVTKCPFICSSGMCAGSCMPGTSSCNGAVPELCNSSGIPVPGPVTAGQCGAACTPAGNPTQCVGPSSATPQTCNPSGQWASGSVTAGKCGATCTPGGTQCSGTTPQTCSSVGQWVSGSVAAGQCGAQCNPGQTVACTLGGYCTAQETCSGAGSYGACSGVTAYHADSEGPPAPNPIVFTDSTGAGTQVGSVTHPPGLAGTWTLHFTTSQSGNVDNTHSAASGDAGLVQCADGSGAVNLGSEDFTNGSFSITCPYNINALFYKETNWGGGCCGGYTRNYSLGTITYTGC